ncbi:MAG: SDR family oxidoreductase, partial [Clostridia bacterium]|nr:SDR family oxidoreductase [Clostridia bacterium]
MKTALVTGACINTGVDIVKRFAEEGYNVAFTGRSPEKVAAAEALYKEEFPNVTIRGFARDSHDADGNVDEAGVHSLFEELDELDLTPETVVFNAADIGLGMKIFESSLADFQRVLNTNVLWNYCMVEEGAKRMVKNGGGNFVFVNSNTAYRAIPDRIAYVTSKGAQLGMMRALALDLGKYGIRVNAVLPGMIKTDRWEKNPDAYRDVPSRFTPIGDVAVGKDIADAVYYLAAHGRNTTG